MPPYHVSKTLFSIAVVAWCINHATFSQAPSDCGNVRCAVIVAKIVAVPAPNAPTSKAVYAPLNNTSSQPGFRPANLSNADAVAIYQEWKTGYVETCPNGSMRVKFDNAAETVSEGIGYGMLLAAYHGDKSLFDGLWLYYKKHLDVNGLMDWKIEGCTQKRNGTFSATDGDLDVAAALVVASKQWPLIGRYATDATALIAKIKQFETTTANGLNILKPGDAFGSANCTNASYFSPAYYRLFAQNTPTDAAFWNKLATDTYTMLNANANTTTGLVSDWQKADGTPGGAGCGMNYAFGGLRYSYDAARTPWRIMTDYLWWNTATAQTYSDKVSDWVAGPLGGIAKVKDGFEQNGTVTGLYQNSTFIGAFAVGSMSKSQSRANNFAAAFKNLTSINDPNYFNKTLRSLYALTLTGNFWNPAQR